MRALVWTALLAATLVPVAVAATSPLLEYRGLPYIASGLAGAVALALLLVQPLLAGGYLPGLRPAAARRWHRRLGTVLVACVALHVGGLYITSPPDALDALMLVSPTPFSVYGVAAMWAVILTVPLVVLRARLRLRPTAWAWAHNALAVVVVIGTVVHALLIEGTMGAASKWALCVAVLLVTAVVILRLRVVKPLHRALRSRGAA